MKKIFLSLWLTVICFAAFAQDITGSWNGTLDIQGNQLRLVLNITKTPAGLSATMDSPDQGANDIPVTTTSFENGILKFSIENLQAGYEGTLGKDNIITGTFKQGPYSLPLSFAKQGAEIKKTGRLQEPKKPYPYEEEEVSFINTRANISLAGTLTLPNRTGVFPAVILISGSGPQNRDEELLGHKPFLVLSDYLTRNSIAVLRFDDRGTASSKGNFSTATSADFATDVEAAIAYLKTRKEIDGKKIGLAGHSEGGVIAPMVAGRNKDVAFIVLLAGTGIRGDELLVLQEKLISRASGTSEEDINKSEAMSRKAFAMVLKSTDTATLRAELTAVAHQALKEDPGAGKPKGMSDEDYVRMQVNQVMSPWMLYFIKYDPAPALEKVTCPVLALNGSKDLQVPPRENLEAIKNALEKGGNKKYTILELPGLNHLFQECKTGSPEEYAKIEQTFSPVAMEEVVKWIKRQMK